MKHLKLFGIIITTLLIAACTKIGNSHDYAKDPQSDFVAKAVYERIDNTTHKDDLITTEYSLADLQKAFSRIVTPSNGHVHTVAEIESHFPIECIRKVSNDFYYVIYKVKEGGYLYIHLLYPNKGAWTGEDNALFQSNAYYIAEEPSIKDIKIGDTFTDVATCDKNIENSDLNFLVLPNENGDGLCWSTVHIQNKKGYIITYEDCISMEAVKLSTVKAIKRISNLTISPSEYKKYNYKFSYKLLDIDQ